jgi:4-hydroxybenzoate polyprenyltransferase
MLMILALLMIGAMAHLGPWYFSSIGVTLLLMGWHQWLARHREPAGCFQAFQGNHYVGMAIFLGIALDYTFRPAVGS